MLRQNTTQTVTEYLTRVIVEQLDRGQSMLWLLSGGDAIKVQADISKKLQAIDTSRLTATLMDERYGKMGHADENWQQLLDAGFSLPQATTYRTLIGENRKETAWHFEAFLHDALQKADYSIGLFGLGVDGHTAGIKPFSPATTEDKLVSDYESDDYERITMTPRAIRLLHEAVLYVKGSETDTQVEKLLHETIPIEQQPVQILKDVPKSTLFIAR